MATFGDILTKVKTRLKDPNSVEISSSDVATVINDAMQHWSKRRYWFNEFQETVTLVENDPALPALSVTPLYLFQQGGITINYASTRWTLQPVSSLEYDEMNVQGRGIPFAYVERNGGYELYYYPDAAYSAIVRGVKAYSNFATDGSQDSQSNDWTINAADLVMYEALSRLFGEIKQDPKMEAYYTARAENENKSLLRQTNKRKSTGRFAVEGF